MSKKQPKKLVGVFGGGGALGSYTVGLLSVQEPEFDYCYGTSTGGLIAALAVCGKFDALSKCYTSITAHNIFNKAPYNKKGKLKKMRAIVRTFITKKKGLAKPEGLEKLIRANYTQDDHDKLKEEGKGFCVTACQINRYEKDLVYFCSTENDYETMVKALLATAAVPWVFEPVEINGGLFVDGGLVENVAIKRAREEYPSDKIVIYVHQAQKSMRKSGERPINNAIDVLKAVLSISMKETNRNDLSYRTLRQKMYELPYNLAENSLLFDKENMTTWYKQGRADAFQEKNN